MRVVFFTVSLAAALGVAAAAGYAAGRKNPELPTWVPAPVAAIWSGASSSDPGPGNASEALNSEYEFRLTSEQVKPGQDAIVSVLLVHKPTGKPVADAVVFARRLDMAPEGMPTMTAPLEPQSSTEPGVYQFKTNLAMEGGWQLSLAAKVQGQTGTVQNRLMLKAVQS